MDQTFTDFHPELKWLLQLNVYNKIYKARETLVMPKQAKDKI